MVLGVAVTRVERLANGTRHREARDRRRLASDGLSAVLGLEESSAHGPAARPSRCARADSEGGARESALGRATDPRRAAEARRAGLTGNHCEVHQAAGDTALAVMPHLRGHSRRSDRGGRFLRRPDGHRSPAVRARPSGTRAPPNRPCRRPTLRQPGPRNNSAKRFRGIRRRTISFTNRRKGKKRATCSDTFGDASESRRFWWGKWLAALDDFRDYLIREAA